MSCTGGEYAVDTSVKDGPPSGYGESFLTGNSLLFEKKPEVLTSNASTAARASEASSSIQEVAGNASTPNPSTMANRRESNDLSVPLNDTQGLPSPVRIRKYTTGSEDMGPEKAAKLHFDMDNDRKGQLKQQKLSPVFKFNAELSLRVAFGVLIASAVQTRPSDYHPGQDKKWAIFPSWYFLGGLSYCANAVIFSTGRNIGGTIREVYQSFMGVGLALVYNIALVILFNNQWHYVDPDKTCHGEPVWNLTVQKATDYGCEFDGFHQVERSFMGKNYYVDTHNFFFYLPFITLFTLGILLLPIETNTKKFALGNNLFFALTIINPMSPGKGLLKMEHGQYDATEMLKNLALYFVVGILGSLIALVIMFIPYPIFGIHHLRRETRAASEDILDLLNIIVDSYCFKNKNVEQMNFLKLKLNRKFDNAVARLARMNALLEDVWWEQFFGAKFCLSFNRSVLKRYVQLYGSLIADLRSLNNAMLFEKYEQLHFMFMKVLQREIYLTQMRSGDLLGEISREIHNSVEKLDLRGIKALENQMESTLRRYQRTQSRLLSNASITAKDVEGNVPLNLFLFSLNSFCSTLIDFQKSFNSKDHGTASRARKFARKTITDFFVCHQYDRLRYISAFKVTLTVFIALFFAVYVYTFQNTAPAAIAFVMGNHIGGSFSVTVNRVAGVVAGSVVPSVFQFFFAQIPHKEDGVCTGDIYRVILSDIVLFFWVTSSMYVKFSGGYGAYSGLVSAFISAGILLSQPGDPCASSDASLSINSYASLAQTSLGVILFVLIELAMCPESAMNLLRRNIQETLQLLRKSFDTLFGHHLSTTDVLDEEKIEEIRQILQVKVPALLAEQERLIFEANAEPTLWRPVFSHSKYQSVLDSSYRLLNNNNLFFKLVKWFSYRMAQHQLNQTELERAQTLLNEELAVVKEEDEHNSSPLMEAPINVSDPHFEENPALLEDTRAQAAVPIPSASLMSPGVQPSPRAGNKLTPGKSLDIRSPHQELSDKTKTHQQWEAASFELQTSVGDTFETLQMLFGEGFLYADADQTAVFMQMKEAFREADKDCSGEIDADEVAVMLESIFKQSGGVTEDEIHQYVEQFMEIVDKDRSGMVSFEEFMEALDNGLKLEVEVYNRHKPKATRGALTRQATRMMGKSRRGRASSSSVESTGRASLEIFTPKDHRGMNKQGTLNSPMRREHDVLNVEDFTILQIAEQMKTAYVEWLLEDQRFKKVSMEELLLLNCLVSGAEGIARNLTSMEEIVLVS